jgi:O-antigen/teichoic acid export membrane protein
VSSLDPAILLRRTPRMSGFPWPHWNEPDKYYFAFFNHCLERNDFRPVKHPVIAKTMETFPPSTAKPHAAFFRQSGWIMIATIAGGMMSWGVHFLSKKIPPAEYGIFVTLLMLVSCVPTMPLQMVFAQQTASALAGNRQRQLAGMIRICWFWITMLWLAGSTVTLMFQQTIVDRWKLSSPASLWVTLLAVLFSLWYPMFSGVLQGCQNFFWMGWIAIVSGVVRLAVAALIVLALSGGATGMVGGAAIGLGMMAAISIWQSRSLWTLPKERFDGRALSRQVVPLMLGFGAFQFMFASDMMFAKPHFTEEEMACYGMAGTLARALLWLVLPLAAVMFPKIVHSSAKAEKTNLLGIVFGGTAVLAICGGIGLWVLGPWVIKVVGKAEYVATATALLPWYAGAMIPFALANVLVNDLLARGRFKIVPLMVFIAIAYGLTLPFVLNHYPKRLEVVLQVLGGFNLLLLATCAWIAFKEKSPARSV